MKNHTGYAEARIYDAAGNELASHVLGTIDSQGSYVKYTMPFTWHQGMAKAAKLSIVFRSTNKGKPIDGSSMGKSDVNTVSFSSDKWHNGSILFIDDITLNY